MAIGALFAVTMLALGRDASAQPAHAADTQRMRNAMHTYFAGELREAWVFGAAGIVTAGGAAALFAAHDDLYRGAAFPMAIVGVVQLAAGIVLLARTDAQVSDLDARLDRGKRAFLDLEAPRMQRVRSEFGALEVTELALLVAGLGLASFGGARRDHRLTGIGGGLALQSALMLTFDAHASARAEAYAAEISAYAP